MIWSLVIIVGGTALSVLAMFLLRDRSPSGGHLHEIPAASGLFGVVGTGFAVLLAFVIVTAFGNYLAAKDSLGAESVAMRQLAATAEFFPAAERDRLQSELVCYGRAVVNLEWPAMQRGQESDVVTGWVARLDTTIQLTPIASGREAAALQNWFDQSQQRQEGRRGRLAVAAPSVPGFLWVLLIALAVLVIGYGCLFVNPDAALWSQAAGVVALAATLLSGLVLVLVLDRPFNDRGAAIPATRIASVVVALEQAYGGPPLPCDPSGRP